MERYRNLIHNNIQAFISNYLIDGAMAEVSGLADVDAVIYEKFPYMSIAYMLNASSLMDDYNLFVKNHKKEIAEEFTFFEKIFGSFFKHSSAILHFEEMQQELQQAYHSLKNENEDLANTVNKYLAEIMDLHMMNHELNDIKDHLTMEIDERKHKIHLCEVTIRKLQEEISFLKEECSKVKAAPLAFFDPKQTHYDPLTIQLLNILKTKIKK